MLAGPADNSARAESSANSGDERKAAETKGSDSDPLFATRNGTPIEPRDFNRAFEVHRREARRAQHPYTLAPDMDRVQMKAFFGDLYHGGAGKPDPLIGRYSRTPRSHVIEWFFGGEAASAGLYRLILMNNFSLPVTILR
jgi:hypothetical protein